MNLTLSSSTKTETLIKRTIKGYAFLIILLLVFSNSSATHAQAAANSAMFRNLEGTHDLTLPDWGPYSKRYIGVSHIPDKKSGIRFDLSVFPGFYRRKVSVPNVLFENDYHPWEASPNLEFFSFRHELEWKDQVYTDISYSEISSKARLIRIECNNNTTNNQNLALHFMASVNFPPIKEYSVYTPIYPGVIKLPEGAKWIDALDYKELRFFKSRPQDDLVYDGKMRGEIRDDGFINGSAIGDNFGLDKGDFVSYRITVEKKLSSAALFIRYKLSSANRLTLKAEGLINREITLQGHDGFSSEVIDLGKIEAGTYDLKLTSLGGSSVSIDGFVVTESSLISQIKIEQKKWNPIPEVIQGPTKNSIILKYEDIDLYYGLLWQYDLFEIRQWNGRELSDYFKQMVNEHVKMVFEGEGLGHYTNI
ncbi:MAG: hypothetical protein ACM3MI_06780, partial [Clostridiales bacterium]